jgi:hypothetical protein
MSDKQINEEEVNPNNLIDKLAEFLDSDDFNQPKTDENQ